MKKISFGTLLMLAALLLVTTVAMAQEKAKPIEMQAPTKQIQAVDRVVLPPKADLRIDSIHSTECPCGMRELPGVDAFYVSNILVDVANASGKATTSTLTVTYHDLNFGPKTITKTISSLNPYPTNPWALQMFKVLDQPALIKKSTGIRAEIQPTAPVTDSNPANNVKTVHECSVMIY